MDTDKILNMPVCETVEENPVFSDFFSSFRISAVKEKQSFSGLVQSLPESFWEDNGISPDEFTDMYVDFIEGMSLSDTDIAVESLEVLAGNDKSGHLEACSLLLRPGEVTCIVGPTGSGKSRLLADIEWLANEDTPTKRRVLINGNTASEDILNRFGGKLIAQITQNMNFVLDMDVYSFLLLHARSRFLPDAEKLADEVITLANELSGEAFTPETPVTFLSGGQSRALMIADVACIGQAPVVLIDEIENAGVNKKKALELLVQKDKIVLMATHDPLLILLAERRVVIKNGGMHKIITTTEQEKEIYAQLEKLDDTLQQARNNLRNGCSLESLYTLEEPGIG